ncbi:acetoacetate metabolism transcriptional regulator AtoC [Rhodospirillum rubrum]|uniref:Two component, sigma54 specific, transcriptional regulator, Fis family n=1 Tax=Rhodospirillum rubrum (strain ATCC 11170 / ATH 1.1.1 / DSM 467 / LMG 4362 / NCIMB 8255 / S1) TaxID=269796 RepID=Q2RUK9_RHORT|nr:acetoacetate metabolism transcriptional regulator AtoC [Rhodospirillum rubrum]ABC22186.1 two component, sigma54 specific, transcriptional regulator, Fis family [Rhodospirillum rubrum ATCC 11170]AEO47901.1 acetoacetate metabolism regulatory protein AtoC [Rhodospirillum rubrum F11]MBK5953776.1 two-component system response regulator [Rhodospirillum rubrum]QXG81833.1 acetoacetate metabolism transcriptional regulator AtoC [Rhodospirillum rubrum]HAQ01147.1 two-component system response regulator
MLAPAQTVLIVDDDEAIRQMLSAFLSKEGLRVVTARDGLEAIEVFRLQRTDVVLLDIRMPRMNGLEAAKAILEMDRGTAVILMTAFAEVCTAVQAIKDGAFDYVIKPFDLEEIRLLVRRALEIRSMRADIVSLRRELSERYGAEGILTDNPKMMDLRQTIAKVARSQATVLIQGESGTGKELVAASVHYGSPRATGPFIRVNCAAIPEGLLESEFFGHEKGAFTGAATRRRGRFEQAEHGTLFLDEIGEISPALQVKLLRVLQEREYERVGGSEPIPADVRIVAATNRDLEAMIREGTFRQDLFFRLNVVALKTIPLRDRPEDIRLLADHFLGRFAADNNVVIRGFDPAALDCMLAYPWPGNVRELVNAVERAVVMSTGNVILRDDLPENIICGERAAFVSELLPDGEAIRPLREMASEFETRVIRLALARNGGNRARTAIQLGISRRALLYKLQEYAIT